jgi:MoxR-like ATPase
LGPEHANLVLLDEINRASAKTQSAMLEAMQERQTSIAGQVFPLPDPFVVLATQNPIEQEGTYHLPEAQLDRFLLKEVLDYPDFAEEIAIMDLVESGVHLDDSTLVTGVTLEDLRDLRRLARKVYVDPVIKGYIARLVLATRQPGPVIGPAFARYFEYGSSPRASIAFVQASKALAVMAGRDHVLPEDVKYLRHTVLRHRLILTYEALADNVRPEQIIDAIFAATPTP